VLQTEVIVGPDRGSGAHSGRASVTVEHGNGRVDSTGMCGRRSLAAAGNQTQRDWSGSLLFGSPELGPVALRQCNG